MPQLAERRHLSGKNINKTKGNKRMPITTTFRPTFLSLMWMLVLVQVSAQGYEKTAWGNQPLKWKLNETGAHWIALHTYGQFWSRILENNPGSLLSDQPQNNTFDISVRRFRLGVQAQLTDKLFVYSQVGINNLNYLSPRGTATDLLDAYAEYGFSKEISIGAGKTAWTGLSRYSAPNTSKLMTYDLLLLALPTADETNDLIRKLSLYGKGKLGNLDYRMVFSKPFSPTNSPDFDGELEENKAKFTDKSTGNIYSGYLKWEFLEKETNKIPFADGTYLGAKKIFNLGLGAEFQNNALASLQNGETGFHDLRLLAADIFLDLPLQADNGNVLTVYAAYFNYDFGPNYIRNTGVNNPIVDSSPGQVSFNGSGNAFPVVGTGDSFHTQLGYLFPYLDEAGKRGRLQPYISMQYSNFDILKDPMAYYDIGVNWYLKEHLSKFSINIRNRPIFEDTLQGVVLDDRKWSAILQYIIRLE
ncbi:porin [Maribacter litoralis]|uniref:porin n=1 Tax=Maribacter litoralis TaxID=2059726 RepID=UPI003F5CD708